MGVGIVSPKELIAERTSHGAGAIVVDARCRKAFLEGHVPGAIWMGWESWCKAAPDRAGPILAQEGYWGVLAPVDQAACGHRLTSLGLSDDRPIVVYADGPRTRGREGRIAWMLLYFGAGEVYLLDAGWSGWGAAGGAVQDCEETPETGHMSVCLHPERRRTLDELKAAYREGTLPVLIDTRSPPEFAGEEQGSLPRRGHLPGAQLLPFADLFDTDGRYTAREHYVAGLPPTIQETTSMVAYCEVGVRASLFAMLHEAYTGNVVPVYDGSLMEWGLEDALQVEASSQER